ncbi:MAG TPA: glycoside hydrolase family 3 protein, partial [Sphingomicrobium sp.]|nr:glycoside hydrolase family 3 protein [Sphingomicrobium sp.]
MGTRLGTTVILTLLAGTAGIAQPAARALPVTAKAIAHPDRWPAAASPSTISDAATEARIDRMIAAMTLEQKVGQTIQADISAITPQELTSYPLGSILAGGNSGPFGNERAGPSKWSELVKQYRAASPRLADGTTVPIIFGVDAVHGHSNVPGATIFPHNIALGATHDPALIEKIGAATAAEVSASGIEWTFAPTLAVPQDLRWGRSYEGYSSDPKLVASYARAMTLGLQGTLVAGRPIANDRVAATPKHFLADGGTTDGKDQGSADIGEAELIARHAQGYPPAIDAGALTVMVSFSSWNGVKHHGNHSLITDVLKGRMGFKGLVVGDWNAHGQVDGCTTTHCPQSLNAGLDLFMAPDSWKGLYEATIADVKNGRVPMARLDDAVRRILRVKAKLGLLDGRPVRDYPAQVGAAAHRAIAREAVAKSLVLLKNEGSLLPIKAGARVLVAGDGADNMAKQAGGWTITWQGTDTAKKDFPNGQTIFDGLKDAIGASGGTATLSADGSYSAKPDVAIVVFGEAPYAEFQGDIATLDYQPQGASDLALLKKLRAAGIPVVSVFLSGRPLFTSPEINASNAFVAGWLPGSEGGGVADVLVAGKGGKAKRDFTGRLPFAWPADARSPVARPLWPTGYGLSYARPGRVGTLSEAPGVDIAKALNVEHYFDRGRALAPWVMSVSDDGGARPVPAGAVSSPNGKVETRGVDMG